MCDIWLPKIVGKAYIRILNRYKIFWGKFRVNFLFLGYKKCVAESLYINCQMNGIISRWHLLSSHGLHKSNLQWRVCIIFDAFLYTKMPKYAYIFMAINKRRLGLTKNVNWDEIYDAAVTELHSMLAWEFCKCLSLEKILKGILREMTQNREFIVFEGKCNKDTYNWVFWEQKSLHICITCLLMQVVRGEILKAKNQSSFLYLITF